MYIALFILSLPALRLMLQFDAVLELTAILKFSIKLLTTSNERPTQYGPLGRICQDVKHHGQFKLIKLGWVLLKRIYILPLPGVINYKVKSLLVKFNQV